jgi:predicted TIM-barrel fold metal-dependent hydrolase
MISADCHANEPATLWAERIEPQYRHRVPRVETDANGVQWRVTEGYRPDRLRLSNLEGEDQARNKAGATPEERLRDHAVDGIDGEAIFPNKGLAMWATPDPVFAMAMCRVWNDWAWQTFGPYVDRLSPAAALATGDLEGSLAEVQRVAKLGFRFLTLPCKPIWGGHDVEHVNYNLPHFDPLWAAIQDADLGITFHVSTGRDPRAARGNGGAVINYVSHSLSPTIEPVANLCASGVLERFPKLRFATIEAGIGWIPWLLGAMDEAYLKHHFWVRPKLKQLPSEFFRQHGFASFQEDKPGLDLAERYDVVDNIMWGNDYPHHEGTWPHSAEAIERTMGGLSDGSRAKVLGLNAARFFGFRAP